MYIVHITLRNIRVEARVVTKSLMSVISIFSASDLAMSDHRVVRKNARNGEGVKEQLGKGLRTCGTPASGSPPAAGSSCAHWAKEGAVIIIITTVPFATRLNVGNISRPDNVPIRTAMRAATAANMKEGQYNGPKGTTAAHLA